MERQSLAGSLVADRDLQVVLAAVYHQPGPSPALAVAKRANLSTLVTIPVLNALVERELVARTAVEHGPSGRPTWTYQLTAKGRRAYRARA